MTAGIAEVITCIHANAPAVWHFISSTRVKPVKGGYGKVSVLTELLTSEEASDGPECTDTTR